MTLTLKIDGMHCAGCVRRVTAALQKVAGVRVQAVEVGKAEVHYDEAKATPERITSAINAIGMSAESV